MRDEVPLMTTKKKKDPPMVSLSFPKGSDVQPLGFGDVSIDSSVTVIIKGKVTSIAKDEYEWDEGKRLSIKISKCKIEAPGKKDTAETLYPGMKKK